MKHKKLFTTCVVVFSIFVFISIFLLIWFWGDTYADISDFRSVIEIPGLKDGYVPQGIANYSMPETDENGKTTGETNYMFISAYKDNSPARIYVTSEKTGCIGFVTVKCYDPEDPAADDEGYLTYTGHAGGIATNCKAKQGTVWLASEGKVWCFHGASDGYDNPAHEIIVRAKSAYSNDEDAPENTVKFGAYFNAYCKADFCFFYDDGTSSNSYDRLYVGEFYMNGMGGRYDTDANHHITTKDGTNNSAFMYEYNISNDNEYGLSLLGDSSKVAKEDRVPEIKCVYSIPDKVQGVARVLSGTSTSSNEGSLVFSCSYGLTNSKILYYNFADVRKSSASYSSVVPSGKGLVYTGVKLESGITDYTANPTVYFVDGASLLREYDSVPSMSEGMCVINRQIYLLFESGADKYRNFVRQAINYIQCFVPRQK